VLLAATARLCAAVAWDTHSASLRRELEPDATSTVATFCASDVDGLPAPVARFFRASLRDGQPLIRIADVRTEGWFQTGATPDDWRPFAATQRFSTQPPGFIWDARIRIAPFTRVYVRDAYVGGHAEMQGRVLALFPVLAAAGTRDLAIGELQRYLAETAWFPTALLPGPHPVRWRPIDATTAEATLTDRDVSVTARFTFADNGDIAEVFVADRMRLVDGQAVPTPWVVRCGDYAVQQSVRIPRSCEVAWVLPEGPLPYWRGRVVDVSYDHAR
jgi:hypothetical protein